MPDPAHEPAQPASSEASRDSAQATASSRQLKNPSGSTSLEKVCCEDAPSCQPSRTELEPEARMISYSANFEDVILWRVLGRPSEGFYVDVGACHPVSASNTRWFYDRGWRGINIEPSEMFAQLAAERKRDVNLNLAVSNQVGQLRFFEHPDIIGTSTCLEALHPNLVAAKNNRVEKLVATDTLANILSAHAADVQIDFLSIDVEGWELPVLEGNDWQRFRPIVIVIESTLPFTNELCHHHWEPLLLEKGYCYAYFDGINRFYVREENPEVLARFTRPVNLLDNFRTAELEDMHQRLSESESSRQALQRTVEQLEKELSLAKQWRGCVASLKVALRRKFLGL